MPALAQAGEAISTPSRGDCFASLAMTCGAVLSDDLALPRRNILFF